MEVIIIVQGSVFHKFPVPENASSYSIHVGRGYNNDLILTDPYIAKHQFSCIYEDGQWFININDSINGVRHNKKSINSSRFELSMGDSLQIGKTILRFVSPNTPIEETRRISAAQGFDSVRHKWMTNMMIMAGLFGLSVLTQFLTTYSEIDWKKLLSTAIVTPLFVFIWASGWSLAGRFLRHQANLSAHLFYASIVFIISIAVTDLDGIAAYIFNIKWNTAYIGMILGIIFGGVAIGFGLSLSTNSKYVFYKGIAISTLLVLITIMIGQIYNNERYDGPVHNYQIKPSFVPTVSTISLNDHINRYDQIFSQLEKENSD